MSKIAFSLTTELIISLEYCTVAEKRLAVVGHCVTSEYLEVCTDKFFCVSGVAHRQERARAEQERQEGEWLVRERGEEREMGAARVGRDRVANTIVRETG